MNFSINLIQSTVLLAFILGVASAMNFDIVSVHDVDTSSGKVRGIVRYHDNYPVHIFLGVPYAKPPVGPLRFKKPQPVERSRKLILANELPTACIQYTEQPFPWKDTEPIQSEDCLHVNIWVPQSANLTEKLPVLFYIPGGGFMFSSNRKHFYDAKALAAEGRIIVVVVNFRLGALGFLASGNPDSVDAPGNQALYDILEALKWTNKNIKAFGGDSRRITLSGAVSGAVLVSLLCVSPLAQGLFQKAIMESGTAAYLYGDNNNKNVELSQKIAVAAGCATKSGMTIRDKTKEVVACLRGKNAMELAKILNSFNPLASFSFVPMYGNSFLPQNPKEAIRKGDFTDVDILIGDNKDSVALLFTTTNPKQFGFFGHKNLKMNLTYGERLMKRYLGAFPEKEKVIQHYLGNLTDDDDDEIRRQMYTSIGDIGALCPSVYFAEKYAQLGNNAYFYFFTHRPSISPWAPWMGVNHYDEQQFIFGLPLLTPRINYTIPEISLSKDMINIWSKFMYMDNNTFIKEFDWPPYSRESPIYKPINTTSLHTEGSVNQLGPHRANCDFYRPYIGFQ